MLQETHRVTDSTPRVEIPSGVEILKLDPESRKDLEIAQLLDIASAGDAYHPENYTHDTMDKAELKEWMTDDPDHRLRIIGKRNEAGALQVMGYVYLYNDRKTDKEFRRRANEVIELTLDQEKQRVWEMNFWVIPEAKITDTEIASGIKQTLTELTKDNKSKTVVFFADQEDMLKAGAQKNPEVLDNPHARVAIEQAYQDTRVILHAGFEHIGSVQYIKDETVDQTYAIRI